MTTESKREIVSGLYEVVNQQCNADQIHELLKRAKEKSETAKKEIQVSGPKDALVRMLSRAVGLGLIKQTEVYDLIRECEENGQQHIFLFSPESVGKNALLGTHVAQSLFTNGLAEFPRFERRADSTRWADFRIEDAGGRRWLGKLYGHQKAMRLYNRKKTDETEVGYTEILKYKVKHFNTVHVVRWRPPGLLEIRIDSSGAGPAEVVPTRLAEVWERLSPAFSAQSFLAFSLVDAMTKMLTECKANSAIYDIGTCSVRDAKHGVVDFKPHDPDEKLEGDQGRADALKDLLRAGAKGRRIVIRWKKGGGAPKQMSEDLRTEIAGEDFNELIVKARTSGVVLDYVINQLRHFS